MNHLFLIMKKLLTIISFLLIFINLHCEQQAQSDDAENKKNDHQAVELHWGTKFNILRGVTLSWRSCGSTDSIQWRYSTDLKMSKFAAMRNPSYLDYLYEYTFPILKASSHIYYSIKTGENWENDRIFVTSVDTSATQFSFTVGGDSHCGKNQFCNERWQLVSDRLAQENTTFHLFLGDVVHRGYEVSHWQNFFEYGKNFTENKLVFYTWGNHEYHPNAVENFTLPANEKWYSFSQGNALFFCLLSEEDWEEQYPWLVEQLRQADHEWIFVFFHRPFFTRGSHKDEMNILRTTWWKAFDDCGVDVVMSGHTHSYIRTVPLNLNVSDTSAVAEYGSRREQGRLQFVSGGLGGDNSKASTDWFAAKAYSGLHYVKFQVAEDFLHFDSYDESGALIDSLTLFPAGTPY